MSLLPRNNDIAPLAAQETGQGNQLFPVFLKLNHLHTVLIGAGNVGLEKLTALLNNSPLAKVTIVAETILPDVIDFASKYPQVTIYQKSFEADDLNEAQVVVAATADNVLNEQSARLHMTANYWSTLPISPNFAIST